MCGLQVRLMVAEYLFAFFSKIYLSISVYFLRFCGSYTDKLLSSLLIVRLYIELLLSSSLSEYLLFKLLSSLDDILLFIIRLNYL
jgi:hypothetical protein